MSIKAWNEYTPEELVELYTSEGWANFLDFQFALAKIPFLPQSPGPEPVRVSTEKDATYWSVGGIGFKEKEDAEAVFDLVTSKELVEEDYQTSGVYTLKPMTSSNYGYPGFSVKKAYSQATYESIKDEVKSFEARKQKWEGLNETFEEISKQREELIEEILEVIDTQISKRARYDSMVDNFDKYKALAEGNEEVALNFLNNAYPSFKKEFPEFFEIERAVEIAPEAE